MGGGGIWAVSGGGHGEEEDWNLGGGDQANDLNQFCLADNFITNVDSTAQPFQVNFSAISV